MSTKTFLSYYCDCRSIKFQASNIKFYILKHIDNHCIFLEDGNVCTIFDNRPIQCVSAPYSYFAKYEIWKNLKCIDYDLMMKSDSSENDKLLVADLLNGYEKYE